MAYKSAKTKRFQSTAWLILIAVIFATSLYIANYSIQRRQSLSVGAASGKAEFFYNPSSLQLTKDNHNRDVQVWVTVDKPLGFVHAEWQFDMRQLNLSKEITLSNPSLSRVIHQTTKDEANQTGKIVIIAALDKSTLSQAPTGTIHLATISLTALSQNINQNTLFSPSNSQFQLVDTGSTPFTFTTPNLGIQINPTASPTPTPTLAPIPNSGGPTIKIKSPKNGSSFPLRGLYVGITASDPDGISRIEYYFDNQLIKTCLRQKKCDYTYRQKGVAPGSHTLTIHAYDNSKAKNVTTQTLTINK